MVHFGFVPRVSHGLPGLGGDGCIGKIVLCRATAAATSSAPSHEQQQW
jgi:hypothetical protein